MTLLSEAALVLPKSLPLASHQLLEPWRPFRVATAAPKRQFAPFPLQRRLRHQGPYALPQLQRREREQRHHQPGDPKARYDFRFRPAQRLEMMVDRSHLENSLLAQLVAPHLQDDRKRFDYVDAADE